jgi:hypothetical protein
MRYVNAAVDASLQSEDRWESKGLFSVQLCPKQVTLWRDPKEFEVEYYGHNLDRESMYDWKKNTEPGTPKK